MIEVEHLSKTYGSTLAIQDVTFAVEPGEILGFLGPNGAGKTTTMRILAGYLPASGGTAKIAGYDVHEESMAVRHRIGYLPETPPLYPEMTVEGFLHFVARLKRVPAGDRVRQVEDAMTRCNILEKRKVLIRKLSKGFRQRVGIAQAIVHDPPVIILDEPTSGLDPRQIIEVRNLIKSLAGEHTIILSTHILPEVSMTCSRVAIINRGQIVATGSPETLMTQLASGSVYELEVEVDSPSAADTLDTSATGEIGELLVASILQGLPGISSVELHQSENLPIHRHRLRVVSEPGEEPGPQIVATLVASGHSLYEMRRTRASLEDVFLQLTTEEKTAESAAEKGDEAEEEIRDSAGADEEGMPASTETGKELLQEADTRSAEEKMLASADAGVEKSRNDTAAPAEGEEV